MLSAGTFSRNIDTQMVGAVNNVLHVVEFTGRSSSGAALGSIQSWAYHYLDGWRPSRSDSDGLMHLIPFGDWVHPRRVADETLAFAAETLNRKNWMRWREAVDQFPQLAQLPPEIALQAMQTSR